MYDLNALAEFAFSECERFLDGGPLSPQGVAQPLTDEDARARLRKADGTEMNAISWLVGHMSWQWVRLATRAIYARDLPELDGRFGQLPESDSDPLADLRRRVYRYRTGTQIPPDPPSILEAYELLHESRLATTGWLSSAGPQLLASTIGPGDASPSIAREPIGKNVMRNVLHTFTHSGEILAVRQMLGHPEIGFMKMDDLFWPGEPRLD
jgi:hypothetical protein